MTEKKLVENISKCLDDICLAINATNMTEEFIHYNSLAIEIMCNAVVERRAEESNV